MLKTLTILLLSFAGISFAYAQEKGLSKADKRALDSMFQNDEFIKLLKDRDYSYFDVNVGMGNGVFSINNNSLNAEQTETNKIFFSPSIGYNHKSGFSITFSGFLASDSSKLKMYQYAINPAYTYDDKNINAGISYTRFIKGSGTSFQISPFQNDIYASGTYKKLWIQPGIAVGYSTGKIVEYYDTSFLFTPPNLPPRMVYIRDTITTRVKGFSLTASATHEWTFQHLLVDKDALSIQPAFLVNAGLQHWSISHSSSLTKRRPIVQYLLKSRYGDGATTESFTLQSLAFLADVTYYIGKFYIEPQLYLDYYLPSTTAKRFTTVFSVTAGIAF